MKKLILVSFIAIMFSMIIFSCSENNPANVDDNNNSQSREFIKQIDSLFIALNIKPPDNWKIKQVTYFIEKESDGKWGEKKIHSILYLTGDGNILQSFFYYDYSKLLFPGYWPSHNVVGRIFLPGKLIYDKSDFYYSINLGLPLAFHEIDYIKGTNHIKFGHTNKFYKYNQDLRIKSCCYVNSMDLERDKDELNYYYNGNKILRLEHKNFEVNYKYGENGMINREIMIYKVPPFIIDTTYFHQNSNGFFIGRSRLDNYLYRFTYEKNKIVESEPNDTSYLKTYTYQDDQYQKLLSTESKWSNASDYYETYETYEYSDSYIITRINNRVILEVTLDNKKRLKEYYDLGRHPDKKLIFEYYER